MRHAYLIIAHSDYELIKILVSFLDYDNNDLFIHIDKKSVITESQILDISCKRTHIYCYKEFDIRWGTEEQVKCELFLMKKSVESGFHDYYHIISGVDLPIRNNFEIDSFFEKNKGKEFVHFDSSDVSEEALQRVRYYHPLNRFYKITNFKFIHRLMFIADDIIVVLQKILKIKRELPYQVIQKGCNWCSISDDLVRYILSQANCIEKMIYKSECADELFVQTIVANSEYCKKLYFPSFDDDYKQCVRYIKWEGDAKAPKILDESHLHDMIDSDAIFARKFSSKTSKNLITMIDERMAISNENKI